MEMAGGFWTAFMYFCPILFSYLLPPLITVQVQQMCKDLTKLRLLENCSNCYSQWRVLSSVLQIVYFPLQVHSSHFPLF